MKQAAFVKLKTLFMYMYSMVLSAVWKKIGITEVFQRRPKLHKSKGRVQFEIFH